MKLEIEPLEPRDCPSGPPFEFPADMEKIAMECGYVWPKNGEACCEVLRLQILVSIAKLVRHWRKEISDAIHGTMREKMYQHLERRLYALTMKLRNVRRSAAEYKAGQRFDSFSCLHAANERLKEENERLKFANADLNERLTRLVNERVV